MEDCLCVCMSQSLMNVEKKGTQLLTFSRWEVFRVGLSRPESFEHHLVSGLSTRAAFWDSFLCWYITLWLGSVRV